MSHTITAKLNNDARTFDNQSGKTFFVSLGEKNYSYKTKENVWTNYDAALFAKDGQIQFYQDLLVKGAIVTVTGSGIIVDDSNKDYSPKLVLQDSKLEFASAGGQVTKQQAPTQQSPQQNQTSAQSHDFDFDDDIPF